MTTYLLDANVFIQAKNLHYGFDFCPAFWDWIDEAHAAGTAGGSGHLPADRRLLPGRAGA